MNFFNSPQLVWWRSILKCLGLSQDRREQFFPLCLRWAGPIHLIKCLEVFFFPQLIWAASSLSVFESSASGSSEVWYQVRRRHINSESLVLLQTPGSANTSDPGNWLILSGWKSENGEYRWVIVLTWNPSPQWRQEDQEESKVVCGLRETKSQKTTTKTSNN